MLKVYYKNGAAEEVCFIRPVPLVSISETKFRDKAGQYGTQYNINLNGTLISHAGSPIYDNDGDLTPIGGGSFTGDGPNNNFATSVTDTPSYNLASNQLSAAIFSKQKDIRELFRQDYQKIEICDYAGNVIHTSYPIVESINFEEGTYVDLNRYSISLVSYDLSGVGLPDGTPSGIEDFSDTWSIEVDDTFGEFSVPKAYRITRNLSATAVDTSGVGIESWKFARKYLIDHVGVPTNAGSGYPNYKADGYKFSKGIIDIPTAYSGFNHSRTENIDIGAGSFSLSDTWFLMDSGFPAVETSNISIQAGNDSAFTTVSVDGTIRGLNTLGDQASNALERARTKYLEISNSGLFGVGCDIYKRCNNRVAHTLNSSPTTISLGLNEAAGEITYNLEFNNRPVSIFTGVTSETINVNDTYPGDVFAIVPILGRSTGPLLQYTGSRTEYRREVGIEIILDASDIGYGDQRADLILRKPSISDPIKTELINVIRQVSPANEPGVRQYFLSPPTESWNPKTGSYSLNLSWTYELDK